MLNMVPRAELRKERRSRIAGEVMASIFAQVQEPDWDYAKLKELAEASWVMNMIFDAIIREALSPGWRSEAKFVSKCTSKDCGKEFQTETNPCDVCGVLTRAPDPKQRLKLDMFLEDPNPDNEWKQILRSLMWQSLAVDDWFLSVNYGTASLPYEDPMLGSQTVDIRVAKEVWVENSAEIKIVADKRGRLGNNEYFCPACYNSADHPGDTYYGPDQVVCPICGITLLQTAYVQILDGQITSRFAKEEMIHGNRGTNLPRLFGKPRLVSLLRLILSMAYMDRYNLAAYSSGNLKGILSFPEMDQTGVDELKKSVETQLQEFKTDKETGEKTRPNLTLWLGTKQAPGLLSTMPPSRDMQTLDWYKFYREAAAAIYSVTPVFVSIIESGKSGNNPKMQIDVQNRATIEFQHDFEEPFNNQLLPLFGINDWLTKFNDVDPEDEERDARIMQLKAQAANTFAAAGFIVTIDENGEIDVSGEATRAVVGAAAGAGAPQDQTSIATPGNLANPASVFVTGDGPCPWCGLIVNSEDPSTHHTHDLSKMSPPIPATGAAAGAKGEGSHHSGGGKRRQVSLLKTLMPDKYDTYVEPFAGSAALFFSITPPARSVLNDINPDFTTVWNWIKTATPADIKDMLSRRWSATREQFFQARDWQPKTPNDKVWQSVYVARFSFRRNRRSWRGSDAVTLTTPPDWLQNLDSYRKQLTNTEIRTEDWKATVKATDAPGTFYYFDPPYDKAFVKELLEVLPGMKGQWLLSFGYDPELEAGLKEAGFNVNAVTVTNALRGGASGPASNVARKELIAANYPISIPQGYVVKGPRTYIVTEYS